LKNKNVGKQKIPPPKKLFKFDTKLKANLFILFFPERVRRRTGEAEDDNKSDQFRIAAQDVLDMPVDPNEPTYCSCHQVSYGEMIGCDNPDVSVFF
jgi:hypothetical protein